MKLHSPFLTPFELSHEIDNLWLLLSYTLNKKFKTYILQAFLKLDIYFILSPPPPQLFLGGDMLQ